MILIIFSLIIGYIGLTIGSMFGTGTFAYMLGIAGFLSPSLFVLEQIYKEIKKKQNNS